MNTKPKRPPLTAKRRRLYLLMAAAAILAVAATLVLNAFRDSLVFFYSPSDIVGAEARRDVPRDRLIRIGGLVEENSVRKGAGAEVTFAITDLSNSVPVRYRGILPDLFREGQGVVAQGEFKDGKIFIAREILAKHDETYMPREVADAIKKSGKWQDNKEGGQKKP